MSICPRLKMAGMLGMVRMGRAIAESIGIEICDYEGIDENKANANAIWLVNKLMKEHGISIGNVVPHKNWSGKNCPRKLLPIWSEFIYGDKK